MRVCEHRRTRPVSRRVFFLRLVAHSVVASAVVLCSLASGMAGYMHFERLHWRDAFLNAAMLLSGMGPVEAPETSGAKLFAGFYALYSGSIFMVVAGILFLPVAHRVLHQFQWEAVEVSRRTERK